MRPVCARRHSAYRETTSQRLKPRGSVSPDAERMVPARPGRGGRPRAWRASPSNPYVRERCSAPGPGNSTLASASLPQRDPRIAALPHPSSRAPMPTKVSGHLAGSWGVRCARTPSPGPGFEGCPRRGRRSASLGNCRLRASPRSPATNRAGRRDRSVSVTRPPRRRGRVGCGIEASDRSVRE
jgi:hypothetical protein